LALIFLNLFLRILEVVIKMEIESKAMEQKIYEALKGVIDPEVGLNIIDMGLIYTINCDVSGEIKVEMTLTSKGCPMGESIIQEVKRAIAQLYPMRECKVELVWEPDWTIKFVSPEGMKQLGN